MSRAKIYPSKVTASKRYYARHREALVYQQRARNAGCRMTLDEARKAVRFGAR